MVEMVSVVSTAPPVVVTFEGLKEQLAPVGSPPQLELLNVMVWLNPSLGVMVRTAVPCSPGELIVIVVAFAPIKKLGVVRLYNTP